jgi:hypothetical protein
LTRLLAARLPVRRKMTSHKRTSPVLVSQQRCWHRGTT